MNRFGKYSEEQWEAMLAAMREEKFGGEFITEELYCVQKGMYG